MTDGTRLRGHHVRWFMMPSMGGSSCPAHSSSHLLQIWESCSSIPDSRDEGGGMEVLDLVGRRRRRHHHGPSVRWPSVSGTRSEMKTALKMKPRRMKKDEENEEDEDEGMVARAVLPVLSRHAHANARVFHIPFILVHNSKVPKRQQT